MLLLQVLRASDGLNPRWSGTRTSRNDIDRGYYNNMVDEAIKSLSVYGDFERFAADEPYVSDKHHRGWRPENRMRTEPTPFDVR